jgi:hypothetical protein
MTSPAPALAGRQLIGEKPINRDVVIMLNVPEILIGNSQNQLGHNLSNKKHQITAFGNASNGPDIDLRRDCLIMRGSTGLINYAANARAKSVITA